jgi:branched-chain amino acid transport system permease protein
LSAALAAVAGAVYGHFLGAFSPKDFYFDLMFTMIAMLIVGGMLTVTGAIVGTALITAVIQVLRQVESGLDLGFVQVPVVFGLTLLGLGTALLLAIWRRPLGIAGLHEMALGAPRPLLEAGLAMPALVQPAGGVLEIDGLTKRFGGLVAADDVSFRVEPGRIVGLIGPNGAGKTTIVNMICGQLMPDAGVARLDGAALTGLGPSAIARAGLGRTFQSIRLFDRLTVAENITVAALSVESGPAEAAAAAHRMMARLDLSTHAHRFAGTLAYGARRRLEIARALALKPRYLLLDGCARGRAVQNPRRLRSRPPRHRARHAPHHAPLRPHRRRQQGTEDCRGHARGGTRRRQGRRSLYRPASGARRRMRVKLPITSGRTK